MVLMMMIICTDKKVLLAIIIIISVIISTSIHPFQFFFLNRIPKQRSRQRGKCSLNWFWFCVSQFSPRRTLHNETFRGSVVMSFRSNRYLYFFWYHDLFACAKYMCTLLPKPMHNQSMLPFSIEFFFLWINFSLDNERVAFDSTVYTKSPPAADKYCFTYSTKWIINKYKWKSWTFILYTLFIHRSPRLTRLPFIIDKKIVIS